MNERFEDVAPDGRRISDVGGESALIEALASAMQSKLAKNRGKRHWQDAAPTYLIDRLRQEVEELEQAIGGYLEEGSADEDDVWNEAADVANFAAMLADNATGRSEARADSQERPQPALDVDGRDEERMAFKRQEREAAASIMAGDRYCPDPSAHEHRAASQERPRSVYLPMDCPVCGRHRVEWDGKVLRCEKCTTSSEWDGFTTERYGSQERPSIDVERLTRALKAVRRQQGNAEGRRKGYSDNYFDPEAEAIAAEYLRLSGPVGE